MTLSSTLSVAMSLAAVTVSLAMVTVSLAMITVMTVTLRERARRSDERRRE